MGQFLQVFCEFITDTDGTVYYKLVKTERDTNERIIGKKNNDTLENIIETNLKNLRDSRLFANDLINKTSVNFKNVDHIFLMILIVCIIIVFLINTS